MGSGAEMIPDPKPEKPVLLSPAKRRALKVKLYNGRAAESCETCGKWIPLHGDCFDVFRDAHLSHIIPRQRGGDHESNVKIECFDCHIINNHLAWRSDKKWTSMK